MRAWLVAASLVWVIVLTAAAVLRVNGTAPAVSTGIYLALSRLCHQRPERSFHTANVQWPVCARCSGLYLAAPVGAVIALVRGRRRAWHLRRLLSLASLPTAVTIALEWTAIAGLSNPVRAGAALPLGAAVAFALVAVAGTRASEAF
jgi:uncharacterized membrane protein